MPEKKLNKKRKINPRIRNIEIGISNLRKIKIYPLSMNDQKELIDLINEILKSVFDTDDSVGEKEKELIFVSKIVKSIEENIETIIGYVTPDEDINKLMKDVDNAQLSEIIGHVYRDNYEEPVKNVMGLFQPEQLQSVLKRQLPPFAETITTELNISTKKASKKEA